MNPLLAFGLLLLMGGGFYKLSRGAEQPGGEYSRHLTKTEKAELAQGHTIIKHHEAYTDVWHRGHQSGMLQVEPLGKGKLRFTQLGHWQHFSHNRLSDEADYYPHYRSIVKIYDAEGRVTDLALTKPLVVKGDTVVETQVIYLNLLDLADTLAVQHWFNAPLGHRVAEPASFWSYDVDGRHPVPIGWKFQRYP